jgi:hypothetical protein
MDEIEARNIFFGRRTDKTIISKRITDRLTGQKLRIASHVMQGQDGLKFVMVKDEIVLRHTSANRFEIKATFLEDERSIHTLTIQRYSSKTGPLDKQYFSLVGSEIDAFIEFIAGIKTAPIDDASKIHLPDEVLRDIVLDQGLVRRMFAKNPELFIRLAQQEDLTRDLVAVGYRRKQLQRFDALLTDPDFFESERQRLRCRPEDVWQQFFEGNTWIFGYGLSYQFLSKLDDKKLEQIVSGRDLGGVGKRADALMKTRGIISSLCFVEIKRHDTPLLSGTQYRPGVWSPSSELTGGISQVQATVQSAIYSLGQKLIPSDNFDDPTGEELFNIEPRSCLVVGSLDQFRTDRGVNVPKFKSFELYRRNTWRPEIITFDELLQRARFIVEHAPSAENLDKGGDDESCS